MNTPKPGWYFGWNIVAAATFVTLLSSGLRLGFGPFFLPLTQDLGFSRSALAAIVAVGMLVYGLAMPVAGHLVARIGTRGVLLLGCATVLVASVWTVMARGWWPFMLSFGVLLSMGLSFTSTVALTPIISRWFTRQRGMALFFLSTGAMAGMAVMTPVLAHSIAAVGWRTTLMGFAAVLVLTTVPLALWVMRENAPAETDQGSAAKAASNAAAPAPNATLRTALTTAPFWQVALGLFACGYSMNLLGAHGVPMLMDHGFDATTSAHGVGLIGLVAIGGTLLLGRIADRTPRRNLLAVIYGVRGLGFFALVMVGVEWELYTAAAIGGIVWAGSIALSSAILADVYGVRLVGLLYGLCFLAHQIGGAISSWLGGWGYETFGTHWLSFGSAGVLLLLAAAVSLQLPVRQPLVAAPAR